MKHLIPISVWLFLLYLIVRAYLHSAISISADNSNVGPCHALEEVLSNPPFFDKSPCCETVMVTHCGDIILDLFGINSFLAVDEQGEVVQIFLDAQTAIPNRGQRLKVKGHFVVLANNSYFDNFCGIIATDIEMLKDENKKARNDGS